MNPEDPCRELPRFLDGEMSPEEQGRFREHLGTCDDCAQEFRDALQVELLGQMTMEEGPIRPRRPARRPHWWSGRWRDWRAWLAGVGVLVVGLVTLWLAPRVGGGDAGGAEWLVAEASRPLEARLTYDVVDRHYRRFVPVRSGAEGGTPGRAKAPPLQELSRMDARKDFHGIATAYVMHGALGQARAYLERMSASADRDCDLAVVALEQALLEKPTEVNGAQLKQSYLDEALELLEGVLHGNPRHPQALWNRALVLREMGLTLLAAESFDAVARQAEAGWSDEAWTQARMLREDTLARGRDWKDAYAATQDLMTDPGARLPLDEAAQHPGIVRLAFYDAVRTATSREGVERLLPLAQALDSKYGGSVLRDYVERVAERDFGSRAPVARRYVKLVREELPSSAEVMEELRRSGEEDIYLGALVFASFDGPVDVEALARLAEAQGDPWMRLIAAREQAASAEREGAWWKAEQQLQEALKTCLGSSLVYRCLDLEWRLSYLYLKLHRPADALGYAWSGWSRAKAARDWSFEQQFLQGLADVARYQHAFASARAYLEESLARMPEDCAQRTHVFQVLAAVEWQRFRPDSARRELDRALACERTVGMNGTFVLSHLARSRPQPRDGDHLRRGLVELRRQGVLPGREALLHFIEGQFELARSRVAGHALLTRAIELADQAPEEVEARKARAYAYAALIAEAGRVGGWSDALSLLERQLRMGPAPRQCLLAVSLHHERTVVLARGTSGRLLGHYDDSRAAPQRRAEGLVPPGLLVELRECEHVDVLAVPPVHGLTGLLPPDLAWSYRVGRGPTPSPPPAVGPGRHLVVTHVTGPASLRLPLLDILEPPRVPDPLRLELRGSQATPSRVVEAMADASEVELHAHGMFSPAVSDASLVVLAPEPDGRYALTADRVRSLRLKRAPLVMLVTCSAAKTAPYLHEPFSLPVAFIEAGASAVLASTVEIPDTAGGFFEAVRELVRGGAPASKALRDARVQWLKAHPSDGSWLPHVLLFE
ncbi:CHAT domain-containing protein [Pyxidicoccus xibeiensis]|uniref:CHAT domain-containing protein n=1 Tax=Pyxidicoccus xibeiensis TaxID=2906759 RepID=UPI0020A82566|nr:CHAT domain-containing protein [Pyxidicoccus xibeiensis]MCP3140855.1 CHAT domain-containing protein [Pyxidicoccus xibeiensis]